MLKKIFLIITILFFTSLDVVSAETCDVTVSVGENIANAINTASSGSNICLKGGVHYPTGQTLITNGGSSGSYKTIKSVPGEQAVIDCSSCNLQMYQSVFMVQASYVRFQNFEIRNTPLNFSDERGITFNGEGQKHSYGEVIDMEIHDMASLAVLGWEFNNLKIEGGKFYNLVKENNIENRARFEWNWSGGVYFTEGSGFEIRNVSISNVWGEAIGFHKGSSNGVIENNLIYKIWGPVYVNRSNNVVIRNNYIVPGGMEDGVVSRGIAIANEDEFVNEGKPMSSNIQVLNNVIVYHPTKTNTDCINTDNRYPNYTWDALLVENNTCVNSQRAFASGPASSNSTLKNNIFYNTTANFVAPGYTVVGNLVSSDSSVMQNPNADFPLNSVPDLQNYSRGQGISVGAETSNVGPIPGYVQPTIPVRPPTPTPTGNITPTQPVPTPSPVYNADFDVNKNGKVDLFDVIDLLKYLFM